MIYVIPRVMTYDIRDAASGLTEKMFKYGELEELVVCDNNSNDPDDHLKAHRERLCALQV